MGDLEQQIEATNKQLESLKSKKKALQAKMRNAKRAQKRKDETRKKILAGAAIENYFKRKGKLVLDIREGNDQYIVDTIEKLLGVLITNDKEREFLKLGPQNKHSMNINFLLNTPILNQEEENQRELESFYTQDLDEQELEEWYNKKKSQS
tara:strand:- start:351 stop:803 length:453 start_codon:yes stop_codon:yes gene_type:complete